MTTDSRTQCEHCGRRKEAVTTRPGRGAQTLCDACDAWITDRMRAMTVEVPDAITRCGRRSDTDSDAERVLALNPALEIDVALESATAVSYEAIGHLEAAGFETVRDLWTADRDDLLAVPHVSPRDVDEIIETISTCPDRDLDDSVEDIPGFSRLDEDEDTDDNQDH